MTEICPCLSTFLLLLQNKEGCRALGLELFLLLAGEQT